MDTIYSNSPLVEKVKQNKKLTFLDIDSTMTVNPDMASKVREELNKQGYAVVFVTSRTEEMMMSSGSFKKSKQLGFGRETPHLGYEGDKRVYKDPESLEEFGGLLDPEVMVGQTGGRIMVRQKTGGYLMDQGFEEGLGMGEEIWKERVWAFLDEVDPDRKFFEMAPVNFIENFESGLMDVEPPNYWVQLNIRSKNLEEFKNFKRFLRDKLSGENIRVTDDSESDEGRFFLYLTPEQSYKAGAAQNIINHVTLETGLKKSELKILFAGDSFPDVEMGIFAGEGSEVDFLIVGGSRLTEAFMDPKIKEFAGESLGEIKRGLTKTGEKGVFKLGNLRRVIIGDIAYPDTKGPETILGYLKSNFLK